MLMLNKKHENYLAEVGQLKECISKGERIDAPECSRLVDKIALYREENEDLEVDVREIIKFLLESNNRTLENIFDDDIYLRREFVAFMNGDRPYNKKLIIEFARAMNIPPDLILGNSHFA